MSNKTCEKCGSVVVGDRYCEACLLQLAVSQPGNKGAHNVSLALPTIEELNLRFTQLEVVELIGRGGMGAIYRARQTSLDRYVALKLIAREVSQDPAFTERFEREAKTLAKLSHPNIVTVYDFGYTSDGIAYLIMEFVDGINLREAIQSRSVDTEDSIDVAISICRALEYAHSRGVIHRDIKPENILLSEDGSLKVVDFGIAKIVDENLRVPTLTATRQVLGSLHYLAPEQIESPQTTDHRIDLYALGVVFYELLTKQLPLGRYEPPSAICPGVDRRLDAIILKLLSRRPADRYANARDVETEIEAVKRSEKQVESPFPPALPAYDADAADSVSVPISYDTFHGFAEVVGMAYAKEGALVIEYRHRDKLMGTFKSQTHSIVIPVRNLSRFELKAGLFQSSLIIAANRLSALEPLPGYESGTVELQVKRRDVPQAKRLLHQLGHSRTGDVLTEKEMPLMDSETYSNQVIFGGLMIICGIINLGGLAIGQILNANLGTSSVAIAIVAVFISVLIAPTALMQVVVGILNFVLPMQKLDRALSVVSLLPIGPAWPLSFPTALWALPIFDSDNTSKLIEKKSWGATTLMFIRESRWSRAMAVGNVLAAIAIVMTLGTLYLGFYPTTMYYRIVGSIEGWDTATQPEAFLKAVQNRLTDQAATAMVGYDKSSQRLWIRDWIRNKLAIERALAIEESVQLVWLLPDGAEVDPDAKWFAFAKELPLGKVASRGSGLSATVAAVDSVVTLHSAMVSNVGATNAQNELAIELTSKGREQLDEFGAGESYALGLIVSGHLEGIAASDAITSKRIIFKLSEASELQVDSFTAAIRGPMLPCELELIKR
jgi:serine/threonine protein kinase